jgi:hypothetical protein
MSRAPGFRGALWIVVVGSTLQSGCIHNHYYGTTPAIPGCPPTTSTVTTQVGSICDVPGGMVVASNPSSNAPVSSSVTASSGGISRVVISQPALGPPSIGQSSGRIKWRKPDPEALPPMISSGGLDESVSR